jgi:malonyl-CoA O-methyltransferase
MQVFDKSKVKANFNQANQSYSHNAILQKMVVDNLLELANAEISNADNIIDLGSGTGFVADKIISNFPDKKICQLDIAEKMLATNQFQTPKIVADIEALPFDKNTFDLALSSLSFQWLNSLEHSISQVLNIVKNNGNFYFSLIADGSLEELKKSCRDCDVGLSINNFIDQKNLEIILKKLDLNYQLKSETIILEYKDFYSILKSMKSIGAGYSKNKQYISRKQFETIANFYLKNFNLRNKVFATWKVLFVSIKQG